MEEASQFDWLVAMDAGKVLVTDKPKKVVLKRGVESLDAAFISYLIEAEKSETPATFLPTPGTSGNVTFAMNTDAKSPDNSTP